MSGEVIGTPTMQQLAGQHEGTAMPDDGDGNMIKFGQRTDTKWRAVEIDCPGRLRRV